MGRGGRILGIDPGTKRHGIAVSDELGITAQGLDTFEIAKGIAFNDYLRDLIAMYNIERAVVGMPLSMGGGDIAGTEMARELAERIRREFDFPVVLRDERLSSREAERILREQGRIKNAGDIDRLAAVLLLQSYLDEINEQA
jgi:putative Holliday junction resolvase